MSSVKPVLRSTPVVFRVLSQVLRWLIILALPIFLALTTTRLTWADWFLRYEYFKPGFSPDRYGMTAQQRFELGTGWVHFYNSSQPPEEAIAPLQAQRLPGSDSLAYTNNEISHMLDVKRVLDGLWRLQEVAGILIIGGLLVLLATPATRIIGLNALLGGGLLTVGLLVVLGLFVALSFDAFFTQLHGLLFPQGNWTFDYTDTLIRLFPEQLWFEGGALIVVATLLEGILLAVIGFVLGRQAA